MCECYKIGGPFIDVDPDCPIHNKNHRDYQEDQSDVIEQLQAKITKLEAENARLKAAVEYAETIRVENIAYFEKQLAVEQLNNKLLREALEAVIKVHGYESGIPVEAISTQASTEALDKYVAEKVKEEMK